MSIRVSVIVPSYKPKAYLDQCLESLTHQTLSHTDFEVILVLNGSGEPWNSSVRSMTEKLARDCNLNIELIISDWGNVSNARNLGLDRAIGEYICFIDDDDFVSPSYLEDLLDKVSADTVSLCYPLSFHDGSTDYSTDYVLNKEYERCQANGRQPFFKAKKYFQGPDMKMIHRDIIGDRRFDTSFRNGEDSIFMFLISDRLKYVDFSGRDAIYYRRIRQGSAQSNLNTVGKRWKAASGKVRMYFKYYFKSPSTYSFRFFATRVLASVNTLLKG